MNTQLTPDQANWRKSVIKIAVPVTLLWLTLALFAPNWYTSLALVVLAVQVVALAAVEWTKFRSMK